jgi:hypothetical protein
MLLKRVWLFLAAALMLAACSPAIGAHSLASYPGSGPLERLQMVTASTGWGWGLKRVVWTDDGARTLRDITPAGLRGTEVVALDSMGPNGAWMVAGDGVVGDAWQLYRTTNAGASWTVSTPAATKDGIPEGITFADTRHGWLQLSRPADKHRTTVTTILRTSDGGATWLETYRTKQKIDIEPNVQVGGCQWSPVRFFTPARGMAGLSCDRTRTLQMAVSDDGGTTWHRRTLPPFPHLRGFALGSGVATPMFWGSQGATIAGECVGSRTGCNTWNVLYRTADDGKTWSRGAEMFRGEGDPTFLDARHVLVPGCLFPCTGGMMLLKTDDGGDHWSAQPLPATFRAGLHGSLSFDFVTAKVGFVVTTQEFMPTRYYRTFDGGKTFRLFHPRIVTSSS